MGGVTGVLVPVRRTKALISFLSSLRGSTTLSRPVPTFPSRLAALVSLCTASGPAAATLPGYVHGLSGLSLSAHMLQLPPVSLCHSTHVCVSLHSTCHSFMFCRYCSHVAIPVSLYLLVVFCCNYFFSCWPFSRPTASPTVWFPCSESTTTRLAMWTRGATRWVWPQGVLSGGGGGGGRGE